MSKKISIEHLEKMTPTKFLKLAKTLDKEFGGILSKADVDITEKIDGSAFRIGLDNGFFVQTSTSPSYYNVGDFANRAIELGYEPSLNANFDNILHHMKSDTQLQSVLREFGDNFIIVGEILYPPLGVDEGDTIKFIRTSYDKDKLGSLYTFVPFHVNTMCGEAHPRAQEIMQALYAISNSEKKYAKLTIELSSDIDINKHLETLDTEFVSRYDNLYQLLVSRKKSERELKLKLKEDVSELQRSMSNYILSHIKRGILGDEFEGIVIKLGNGATIKIVTEKFKMRVM